MLHPKLNSQVLEPNAQARVYAIRLAPGAEIAARELSLGEAVAWCTTYNEVRGPEAPIAVIIEGAEAVAAA